MVGVGVGMRGGDEGVGWDGSGVGGRGEKGKQYWR